MNKKKLIIILLIIILPTGLLLFSLYKHRGNKEGAIKTAGLVEATEVQLSPKLAGKISEICCNEGEAVKEGMTAVRLENEDINASVAQAKAGVERAQANIKSSEAEVERARVQMEEADRQNKRARELFRKEFISKSDLDLAVSGYETSAAAHKASMSQLDSAKAGLREATATLAFNRARLDDTTIKAPLSGTVIFRAAEKGETVTPGAAILTIADMDSLYVRTDIDENSIGNVTLNAGAEIKADGLPDRIFKGKVSEIGRYAEFATQRDMARGRQDIKTFRVKIKLDETQGRLKPGMTVEVEIKKDF